MRIETHCHCKEFSPDSGRPLEVLMEEAREKGFAGLVLTDHYEKDYFSDGTLHTPTEVGSPPRIGEWVFSLADYEQFVQTMRERYADGPALYMGIEVGPRPEIAVPLNRLLAAYPLDQIIGSLHAVDGVDLGFTKLQRIYDQPKELAYRQALELQIELLDSDFDFDVLAHFDYLTRYAPYSDPYLYYEDFPELFDRLFERLIERNIALELNTRNRYKAFARTGIDPGPSDEGVLKRYYALGGRLITIASDTHESGTLGRYCEETKRWLRTLGFEQGTYFVQRKPQFYDL